MRKIIIVAMILCSNGFGVSMAEEWTTPEALRAFGKPGDTVKDSSETELQSSSKKSLKKERHKKTKKVVNDDQIKPEENRQNESERSYSSSQNENPKFCSEEFLKRAGWMIFRQGGCRYVGDF